ncbi:helicase associated domain-containing protein [Streptomyces sp. NPDC016845]|uniref:helicase associated domain-containing protein n=1 Tax=Streptomyces sp. NPDC016845 TaxID=3364972 RepID=UPI0037A66AA9
MLHAAKLADQIAARREAGEPVASAAGTLTDERRQQLDDIDPGWQRCLRLLQAHLADGGSLPTKAGEVVVRGEDLGRWVTAQRYGFDQLLPAQQWLLENALGIKAAAEEERPVKRTQEDKWLLNLAAARQFHAREGHLNVPRKHVEELPLEAAGPAATGRETTPEGTVLVDLGTCGRQTYAAAPTNSSNNDARHSTSSACAGKPCNDITARCWPTHCYDPECSQSGRTRPALRCHRGVRTPLPQTRRAACTSAELRRQAASFPRAGAVGPAIA